MLSEFQSFMSKKLGVILIVVLLLLSAISVFLFYKTLNQTVYSDELIKTASVDFKANLKSFLAGANKARQGIIRGEVGGNNDTLTYEELNTVFTKEINGSKYLKGIILFNKKINYVIIKEDNTWATTYSYSDSSSMLDWVRFDKNLNEISRWTDTYNFFMNEKNKGIVFGELELGGNSVWRAAQSEIPDKRELFVNVFEFSDSHGQKYIVGLLYKTTEIAGDFAKLFKFKNPLVNIIDKKGKLITPITTSDTAKIAAYLQLTDEVKRVLGDWSKNRDNQPYLYSYEKNKQVFWTRIDTVEDESIKGFTITVSDEDIERSKRLNDLFYLYLAIGLFVIALLVSYFTFRKKSESAHTKPFERHTKDEIIKMIQGGETEFVEFKSSLRYDYRLEKENKILEEVILKSIAAFANAKGGTLFIGVDDDLNILGLEKDFGTLKKNDADYFELHLRKLINNQYGISFANNSLMIYFPKIENKEICIIQVNAALNPLYLKTKNKQGQPIEKFYVRSGNASQQISSLKEINEYIKRRFKKTN